MLQTLEHNIRKDAFIGRYDGEQFLVLLPDTNILQRSLIAERLRRSAAQNHYDYRGQFIAVTISIGAMVVTKDNISAYDDPLILADKALYAAKRLGRNRVVIHEDTQPNSRQPLLQAG